VALDADLFRVAFICTGNRFRSPLAAAVFEAEVTRLRVPSEVRSYGLLDLDGMPALPEAVELGGKLGFDLAAHRSRALSAGTLADADLVVGFERIHVATSVVDAGAARDRTFTLPEVVGLLHGVAGPEGETTVARARAAVAGAARARRGHRTANLPEVADPLGFPRRRAEEIAGQVRTLTEQLATRLFAG
jgi:protein-tyrosine-phosphatase